MTTLFVFNESKFLEECGNSIPARYIASYLKDLQAKTVILETDYVDRHYLSDYQEYYSLSFSSPKSHCKRIHIFSEEIDSVQKEMEKSFKNEANRMRFEKFLNNNIYLGFVVVRPISGASIGRTVLKTYKPNGIRRIEVVRPYYVNLLGVQIKIDGLAYQEQDQGAAVCASIAIWSALQRAAWISGLRPPTPSEITFAANSPLPASYGLDDNQMLKAMNELGYCSDIIYPSDNRSLFRAELCACLESQLPAILLIHRKITTKNGYQYHGHAITVTGFQEPKKGSPVPFLNIDDTTTVIMKYGKLSVLYVHDDNLGPHAHYELFDTDDKDEDGNKCIKIRRGRTDKTNPPWWTPDEWIIERALIPKYRKMRLPIESIFQDMAVLKNYSELVLPGIILNYIPRYRPGFEYISRLPRTKFLPAHISEFLRHTILPRYVGVVAVYNNNTHILDYVLDVTEISRGEPNIITIVAPGVPSKSKSGHHLNDIAKHRKIKVLLAN